MSQYWWAAALGCVSALRSRGKEPASRERLGVALLTGLGWVLLAAAYGALFYAWLNRELSIAPAAAYFTCAAASGCGKAVASLCALCTAICAGVLFTGALPFDVLAFL